MKLLIGLFKFLKNLSWLLRCKGFLSFEGIFWGWFGFFKGGVKIGFWDLVVLCI